MDTAKERLKVICLTLAAVLLVIWILNQALTLGREVDQVVGTADSIPAITPISSPTPAIADEMEEPDATTTPQPLVDPQVYEGSTPELRNATETPTTEFPGARLNQQPAVAQATATGYIDCVMEARTTGYTGFNGRIEVNGNDYSLEQFYPDDWILVLSRESCATSRPAEPLSDRPNCIRQALNLINRNYGLETGSSNESEFAGVLAVDLCSIRADEE